MSEKNHFQAGTLRSVRVIVDMREEKEMSKWKHSVPCRDSWSREWTPSSHSDTATTYLEFVWYGLFPHSVLNLQSVQALQVSKTPFSLNFQKNKLQHVMAVSSTIIVPKITWQRSSGLSTLRIAWIWSTIWVMVWFLTIVVNSKRATWWLLRVAVLNYLRRSRCWPYFRSAVCVRFIYHWINWSLAPSSFLPMVLNCSRGLRLRRFVIL